MYGTFTNIKRDINGFVENQITMLLYLIKDGNDVYLSWSGGMTTANNEGIEIEFPTRLQSDPNNDIKDVINNYFNGSENQSFTYFYVNDCGTNRVAMFSLFKDGRVSIIPLWFDCPQTPTVCTNLTICGLMADNPRNPNPPNPNPDLTPAGWFTNCGVDSANSFINLGSGFWKIK
jgi:hypothetical protein